MSSVGSYILGGSASERGDREVDVKMAAPRLLKIIAERPRSNGELCSVTGFSEASVRASLEFLKSTGLVEGNPDQYRVTPQGEKAHLLVAS